MAERIAYLEAVVGADITQFRKSMRDIRSDVGILSDVIGGISGAARTMTYAFTAPMVALGTYAVQAATTFEAQMRNINSIAFLTETQFEGLSQRVLEFGKNTRSGSQEAANALYEVYSAGLSGEAAFTTMTIGVKTAEAGLADLTTTVKGLTATALTFGDTSEKAMLRYSDATTLAVQLGVGSMDTFNTGVSNTIGTAALLGASYEDLAATMAFLSQRGMNFASAGTNMNNLLTKMIKPSEELEAVFKKLGVTGGKDLITTFGSIEEGLRAIYGVVGDDENAWAKLFPDSRGFKAVAQFVKSFAADGKDAANEFFGVFEEKMKAGGVTAASWEEQMKSFASVIDRFQSALLGVAIVIGQQIIPIISPMVDGFTGLLNSVSDTNPELISMGVAFIGVLAAAAPVVWLLTSMLNPIGILLAAVTALGVAFATNFAGIRTAVTGAVADVLGDIEPLASAFDEFWTTLFPEPPEKKDIIPAPLNFNTDDIIVVTKPTSLWQLYVDKGYDKLLSWDEFMKHAKESGWKGGALNIGDKIILPNAGKMTIAAQGMNLVADSLKNLYAHYVNKDTVYDPLSGKVVEKQTSFLDRLITATETVWPKMQSALNTLWSNISAWVMNTGIPLLDSYGGKLFASISNWFNPTNRGGETEAYGAFRDVIGGGGAAGIQAGIAKLEDTFPQIAAGFKAMVDSIGAWLMTEGIPSVARSVGYFVGSIGALIGQLIGGISGDGAGDLANGLQQSIIAPASEGFSEAMGDKGITSSIDAFFTGLAGMLVTGAGLAVFGQMLVGKGFLGAVMSTIGAALSGGGSIVKAGGNIVGKITNTLLNTSAGAAMANSVNDFGSMIMGKISSGLETAALQGMFAWDKVTAAIGTKLAAASKAVTAGTSWVMAAAGSVVGTLGTALAAAFAAAPFLTVVLSGLAIAAVLAVLLPQNVKDTLGRMITNHLEVGSITSDPMEFQVEVGKLEPLIAAGAFGGWTAEVMNQVVMMTQGDEGYTASDLTYIVKFTDLATQFQDGAIDQAAFDTQVSSLITDLTNGMTLTPTVDAGSTVSVDKIVAPTTPESAKVVSDELLNPVWAQAAANIAAQAASGDMDTTMLASSMAKPFVDEFTKNFGSTGTVTMKWQDFITAFDTGLNKLTSQLLATGVSLGLFAVGAVISNTLAINSFNGYNKVIDTLSDVRTKADELANALYVLTMNSPYEIVVDIVTNGSMPTLPAGAQGSDDGSLAVGKDYIPFNNYRANLHQGEAVLNKGDASVWRNMPRILGQLASGSGSMGGGKGGQQVQYNTININGVQDVDAVLREFKRRGIKIN